MAARAATEDASSDDAQTVRLGPVGDDADTVIVPDAAAHARMAHAAELELADTMAASGDGWDEDTPTIPIAVPAARRLPTPHLPPPRVPPPRRPPARRPVRRIQP